MLPARISIPDGIWSAFVDAGQISQVINNLIINAKQAMPEGGSLEISCENVLLDINTYFPLKAGRYLKITFADSGIGIPKEYLTKIFDPYFTTKESGRGLGLASAYSIMKKHGGHIYVTSEAWKGTVFALYLPATEIEAAAAGPGGTKLCTGQGKVLVMDDEKIIRDIAGEMLKRLGYSAVFAKDGAEAISEFKMARETGDPFDAVIMDLTVPGGMGGEETIKELLAIDPSVKAIVSSGYSDDRITANFREHGFKAALAKPYKIQDISKVIAEVISSA